MNDSKPHSIFLISLDTLRADVAYSGKFPNLNRLRSEGVSFMNVVSSSPLTPVSHASILTGLYPKNHGIRHLFKESLNSKTPTLAETLKREGFHTGAIVSCPGLNGWYGLNKGFDHYDDEIPLLEDGSDPLQTVDVKLRGTALKRANIVIKRAIKWLRKMEGQPCFLFLHFFDAHWPYNPPKRYLDTVSNDYEDEVAFMDHYLGIFLDFLDQHEYSKNSLLICLSDHGEDLEGCYPNDHGGAALGHPEESGHGCLLFDTTQLVPLIFRYPKMLAIEKTVKEQVRLIDVFPTICDLIRTPTSPCLDGKTLAPALSGGRINSRVAFSETFYPKEQYRATGMFPQANNKMSVRIDNKYKTIWEIGGDEIFYFDLINNPNEL
ncbi:MAG: sulfatase [Pseudomonadota bacterium]